VIVNPTRPSLDPRYALGLCSSCSKDPAQADGLDRTKVQQLVARQAYDPKVLEGQRRRRRERRIIRNPREGEHDERARILERYRAEARDRGMPA
jgi:hypothetical protein